MQCSAPRHLEISSTPTVRAKAACGRRPRSRSYWHLYRCHNASKDDTPDSVEGHTSPQMHARTGSRQGSVYMSQGVPICNCHFPVVPSPASTTAPSMHHPHVCTRCACISLSMNCTSAVHSMHRRCMHMSMYRDMCSGTLVCASQIEGRSHCVTPRTRS